MNKVIFSAGWRDCDHFRVVGSSNRERLSLWLPHQIKFQLQLYDNHPRIYDAAEHIGSHES